MTFYTFAEARIIRDTAQADVDAAAAWLDQFPKGGGLLGLTPDEVKFSPEYRRAKKRYDAAFNKLRAINAYMTKNFAKELRDVRKAQRAAKILLNREIHL